MPEVLSLGLGGGSKIHVDEDESVTVGPHSVGYQLEQLSRCFGGDVLTCTDIAVALDSGKIPIKPAWMTPPSPSVVSKARKVMKRMLEKGIDVMKTSDQDVVALLVGGGSIIQIDGLDNVKMCIRPSFSNVANAVGAAIAKVCWFGLDLV